MDNAFGRIIGIMLVCVAVFIVPMTWKLENAQYLRRLSASTKTISLVDNIRNTGELSFDKLEYYYRQLGSQAVYDLVIEGQREDKILDVMDELKSNGYFMFNTGDQIRVKLLELKQGNEKEVISYYGGMIKNEKS